MSKHTPTPLKVYRAKDGVRCGIDAGEDASGMKTIVALSVEPEFVNHIIKCVNLHDELVDALEMAKRSIGSGHDFIDPQSGLRLEEEICAVLAKAKGDA